MLGVPLTLSVHIDPRLREAGLARAAELRGWLSQRYEDAVAAAAANNAANIGLFANLFAVGNTGINYCKIAL